MRPDGIFNVVLYTQIFILYRYMFLRLTGRYFGSNVSRAHIVQGKETKLD